MRTHLGEAGVQQLALGEEADEGVRDSGPELPWVELVR
jgi:hypothetical protein